MFCFFYFFLHQEQRRPIKENKKNTVSHLSKSLIKQKKAHLWVWIYQLAQMFLSIMSICAFCGCHHFYSYSGKNRCGRGIEVYCICPNVAFLSRINGVLNIENEDECKTRVFFREWTVWRINQYFKNVNSLVILVTTKPIWKQLAANLQYIWLPQCYTANTFHCVLCLYNYACDE